MEIVIKAAIVFILLWVTTKATGKGTLGELSSFDLVLFIVMGDLVSQAIVGEDRTLTGGLLAVGTMALLVVGMNFATSHWPKFNRLISGHSIILIQDGTVQHKALKQQRITLGELKTAARQAQVESLEDIRLAILEPNGKISIFT